MAKVAFLVGSLRKESYTKIVATALAQLFPEDFQTEFIEIGHLSLYNQDFDDHHQVPAEYKTFREKMKQMDAVLFATPEYNRSVPSVLKNAIDVGSRPYGQSVYDGKPAAIVSVSPGKLSAFGANHHLRQSLVFLNMPILQQPEAYIGNVIELIDEDGNITNEDTIRFFQSIVDAFVELIRKYV